MEIIEQFRRQHFIQIESHNRFCLVELKCFKIQFLVEYKNQKKNRGKLIGLLQIRPLSSLFLLSFQYCLQINERRLIMNPDEFRQRGVKFRFSKCQIIIESRV